MTVYILLYIFSAFIALSEYLSKSQKSLSLIAVILAGIISGTRVETLGGYDTLVYKLMYDSTSPGFSAIYQEDLLLKTTEKGYILLMAFFKIVDFNFNWFLLSIGFSCAIMLWSNLKNLTPHIILCFTIFLGKGYLYYFFTAQRQIIAMCICWYALRFLKNKKIFFFILLCISAAFFHTSAIIFILVYFLATIRIDNKWSVILLIFSTLIGISGLGSMLGGLLAPYLPTAASEKLTGYITGPTQAINILNYFEIVPVLIFTLVKRNEMSLHLKDFELVFNLFLVFVLITFAFYDFTFIMRVKGYFLIGYIIILSAIPYTFRKKQIGVGPLILIIFYCFAVMFRELITFDYGAGYLPYKSFLSTYF